MGCRLVARRAQYNYGTIALVGVWFSALLLCFTGLWWYKTRPGEVGYSLSQWPERAGLKLGETPFTLVLFLHPKCDCSEASVYELRHVVKDAGTKLDTQVVFYFPEKFNEQWAHSSLWDKVSLFPSVLAIPDKGGKTAYLFGARTSGETYLFNSAGRLLFHGGITESRGHIGDSPGRRSIASIVGGQQVSDVKTKPFGCSLFSAKEIAQLSAALGPGGQTTTK